MVLLSATDGAVNRLSVCANVDRSCLRFRTSVNVDGSTQLKVNVAVRVNIRMGKLRHPVRLNASC